MTPHEANVYLHVGAGALALFVGAFALSAQKGGARHRLAGKIYAVFGAFVLGTATIGNIFFNPPAPLVAATLAAGYQYISSLRALSLRGRSPTGVDALLATAGLAACAALYFSMGPGTPSWTPTIGYSTIGYVAFIALYDLSRHFWPGYWSRHARPLDHGLKMTGAYFAMMSAGVGNVFRDYQPWSQLGPSILGLAVILFFAIRRLPIGRR